MINNVWHSDGERRWEEALMKEIIIMMIVNLLSLTNNYANITVHLKMLFFFHRLLRRPMNH